MVVYQELLFEHPLAKTTASYRLLMQLAMVVGFFTAYPVNYVLLKRASRRRCSRAAIRFLADSRAWAASSRLRS
jgi:hypothetical protein